MEESYIVLITGKYYQNWTDTLLTSAITERLRREERRTPNTTFIFSHTEEGQKKWVGLLIHHKDKIQGMDKGIY